MAISRASTPAKDLEKQEHAPQSERVSGKGDLTRKRTVIGAEATDGDSGFAVQLDVDTACAGPDAC